MTETIIADRDLNELYRRVGKAEASTKRLAEALRGLLDIVEPKARVVAPEGRQRRWQKAVGQAHAALAADEPNRENE